MKLIHPEKGVLTPAGKEYKTLGNKVVDVYADQKGTKHELDGTEKPFEEVKTDKRKEMVDEILSKEDKKKSEMGDEMEFEKNLDEYDQKETQNEEKSIMHREVLDGVKNASEAIVGAVKAIPETIVPEIPKYPDHIEEQRKWKDQILKALKIEIPKVDLKPVIKAIDSIKFPDFPESKDYSELLKEIKKSLPKDTDLTSVVKAIKAVKPFEIPSELIRKGRIKVEVDRAGMGAGGGGGAELIYDTVVADTTNEDNIIITKKRNGDIVDVKNIQII